ncbi:outer membrane protein transport protein [Gallaecimonas sp. GXIMD4217]|uniref:outer membrane protein transport protein n=1 Tax=Gallaecimonas sp. GXIMD4217 TaxID=3131927 RepID=UPI00311B20CE
MQFFRKSLLASTLLSLCGGAYAAGFQVTEHSAAGLGRANAGDGVLAEDASVLAANPAAMTLIDKPTFSAMGAYIMPDIKVEGTHTNALHPQGVEAKKTDVAPNAFVPAMYFVLPLNEGWTLGLGGFGNFGLKTQYNSDFQAAALADESDLITANFNASLAYEVDQSLSLGFGVNAVYAEATLTTTAPDGTLVPGALLGLPLPAVDLSGQNISKLEGDDWGYGWNLGVLYSVTPDTRLGLSYRSSVDLHVTGDISSELLASKAGGFVDVELPALWELAASHSFDDRLAVHGSVFRVQWSSFERLTARFNDGTVASNVEEQWNDVWRFALGTSYQLSDSLVLRAGIQYDESPVDDQHRTLRIPDSSRTWYSLGLGYRLDNNWDIDFGYAYLDSKKKEIHEASETGNATIDALVGRFDGKMSGDAHILALQANYRF